jgi:hypothetical protein
MQGYDGSWEIEFPDFLGGKCDRKGCVRDVGQRGMYAARPRVSAGWDCTDLCHGWRCGRMHMERVRGMASTAARIAERGPGVGRRRRKVSVMVSCRCGTQDGR